MYTINCVASEKWPCLFHGLLDVERGPPLDDSCREFGTFRFEPGLEDITAVHLFCRYDVETKSACAPGPVRDALCMPVYTADCPPVRGDVRCQ